MYVEHKAFRHQFVWQNIVHFNAVVFSAISIQWVVKLIQVSTLSFLFSILHFSTSICSQVRCVWFYHFIHQGMCEMRPRSMVLLVLLVLLVTLHFIGSECIQPNKHKMQNFAWQKYYALNVSSSHSVGTLCPMSDKNLSIIGAHHSEVLAWLVQLIPAHYEKGSLVFKIEVETANLSELLGTWETAPFEWPWSWHGKVVNIWAFGFI